MLIKVAVKISFDKTDMALINTDSIISVIPRYDDRELIGSTINFLRGHNLIVRDSPTTILTKSIS